ncbi:hypothetical protein GALMADRAFT_1142207 [Galerina marginata CBS 339.88]|uniref:Secreted protein n=1 Tax=Galerina marginata (strain CBS 339.88) TaxID=685588 RepID=A0A067S761_GALM3|nr:hypothetical protein GALMADRAFT_1142207 [Galerina marginata CBS 339.88]
MRRCICSLVSLHLSLVVSLAGQSTYLTAYFLFTSFPGLDSMNCKLQTLTPRFDLKIKFQWIRSLLSYIFSSLSSPTAPSSLRHHRRPRPRSSTSTYIDLHAKTSPSDFEEARLGRGAYSSADRRCCSCGIFPYCAPLPVPNKLRCNVLTYSRNEFFDILLMCGVGK